MSLFFLYEFEYAVQGVNMLFEKQSIHPSPHFFSNYV